MDEMERKCRIFLGITPFNTSTNLLCGDPHYLTSLQIQYGKEKIEEKIKELKGEKEDMKVVEEKEKKRDTVNSFFEKPWWDFKTLIYDDKTSNIRRVLYSPLGKIGYEAEIFRGLYGDYEVLDWETSPFGTQAILVIKSMKDDESMTLEEARSVLHKLKDDEHKEAYKLADMALAKQIPQKVKTYINIGDGRKMEVCSVCGCVIEKSNSHYCCECGQAIDWSAEK